MLTVDPPPRRVFYSEVVRHAGPDDEAPTSGAWRSLKRWLRGLRARFKRSDGGAAKTGRKVWDWLHARTHPDEVLYSSLRGARLIALSYPSTVSDLDASRAWSEFLRAGAWRHVPWFLVNVAVAPATLFLALLPGPNVIGYWFLYRAVHHLLILVGLVRAGRMTVQFAPSHALDAPIEDDSDPGPQAERLAAAGLARNPGKLREFLKRQSVGGRGAIDHS